MTVFGPARRRSPAFEKAKEGTAAQGFLTFITARSCSPRFGGSRAKTGYKTGYLDSCRQAAFHLPFSRQFNREDTDEAPPDRHHLQERQARQEPEEGLRA